MRTTSKNNQLHTIPNEISGETCQDNKSASYAPQFREYQDASSLKNNGMGKQNRTTFKKNNRLKTSELDINVFQINDQVDKALDEKFYYELNHDSDSGKGLSQFAFKNRQNTGNHISSSKTVLEQNVFQQMNDEYVYDAEGQREYI